MNDANVDIEYEYQVGGSLRIDAPSYIRRQADDELFEVMINKGLQLYTIQGKAIAQIRQPDSAIQAMQFSPDGQTIVTGNWNGSIDFWTLQGQRIRSLKTPDGVVNTVQFSPDGQRLVTASSEKKTGGFRATERSIVRLWTVQGDLLTTFTSRNSIHALNFTPDGNRLITTELQDANSPNSDLMLRLWNLQGQELESLNGIPAGSRSIEFSPDGQQILVNNDGDETASFWRLPANLISFNGVQKRIRSLQFNSPGDRLLAIDQTNTVYLWDRQGNLITTIQGQPNQPLVAEFTPSGDRFLTYDGGNSIRVWNSQGQQQAVINGRWPAEITNKLSRSYPYSIPRNPGQLISPDSSYTVAFAPDGSLRVWNLNGKSTAVLRVSSSNEGEKFDSGFLDFQFSPNGELIAVADSSANARLWNLQGKLLRTIRSVGVDPEKHPHPGVDFMSQPWRIRFTSNGQRLITLPESGSTHLWDLQGRELSSIKRIVYINIRHGISYISSSFADTVVNPQGDRFVTPIYNSAIVSDSTGKGIAYLEGAPPQGFESAISDEMNDVQFSTDGERIITSTGHTIRVWDARGRLIAEYEGYAAALSPDGRQIVVVSAETNVPTLWQVDDVEGLFKRGCEWLRFAIVFSHDEQVRQMCHIQTVR